MSYVIGVDIGGTFTDCVVVDEAGELTVAKAFSTPVDLSQGIIDALTVAATGVGLSLPELLQRTDLFLHSTSVAENAIVDGTLAPAGLLTTRGFEHTLHMTRGGYGRWSGLSEEDRKDLLAAEKPRPLMPFSMILPIAERTDSNGTVLAQPSEGEVLDALHALVERGATALGVSFLWSFRNPANEMVVRDLARKHFPDLFFTMSSELAPIEGEYERISTVALNVRLGPIIARYLARLRERLADDGFTGAILVMQAHGGLLRIEEAPARAVGMIESGPVGGLVGSRAVGELLGERDILAADMGGTTFKVGVIRDGRIDYEREPRVLRYHYSLHKMEVVSIGVAGGSVISIEPHTGIPKVGPRSAGAYPGPVCYGFGGDEPTVTDVDLLLGYLDPRFFVGGRATLDRDAALAAFTTKVAQPLRMEAIDAAAAVYRLANSIMYDLLHKQTVEKGLDPRRYTMFVYGGTAGMHMPSVARELGVRQVVVPVSASVHGAFGLVSADVVYTDIVGRTLPLPVDPTEVDTIFEGLSDRILERLTTAGFRREEIEIQRAVQMRYRRQVHAITTPLPDRSPLTASDIEDTANRFEGLYAERYGKDAGYREAGIEMVSFLLRASARLQKPRLRREAVEGPAPDAGYVETRQAYSSVARAIVAVGCYDYEKLRPGNVVDGPAIIWTPITTVVVDEGQRATLDPYKNLVITWDAGGPDGRSASDPPAPRELR